MRRERHYPSMLTFPSAPHQHHHVRHLPQGLGELRKSTFFFGGKNSTNWLFSNPPNHQPTFPVHDVIHTSWSHFLSVVFILTSVNDILPARAWTPAPMLHQTNPCAEQKVLSLTKPKGKIYKTKFLGHYITELLYSKVWRFTELTHSVSLA